MVYKAQLGMSKRAPDRSTQARMPGTSSIEACLAVAHQESASKEQPVPGMAHNEQNQPGAHRMHTPSSGEAITLKQNENEPHSHSDLGPWTGYRTGIRQVQLQTQSLTLLPTVLQKA